jgi:hypothetical protein
VLLAEDLIWREGANNGQDRPTFDNGIRLYLVHRSGDEFGRVRGGRREK